MIIWRGYGFVVPVVVFLVALGGNVGFDAALGKGYYEGHWWTVGSALLLSAVIIFPLAIWLQTRNSRVVIDRETGEKFMIGRHDHSAFFIPLRFWSPLLAAIGIALCILEFVMQPRRKPAAIRCKLASCDPGFRPIELHV